MSFQSFVRTAAHILLIFTTKREKKIAAGAERPHERKKKNDFVLFVL